MGLETHRLATLLAAVLAVVAVVAAALALASGSPVAPAALAGLVPAALTAVTTALALRFRYAEAEQERALAGQDPATGRLFGDDAVFLDAQRSRQQFERYFIPGFCVLLAAVEGGASRWLWVAVAGWAATPDERVLFAAAMLGGFAFLAFIAGRVIGALAAERAAPAFEATADWLLLTAATAAAGAAGALLARDTLPAAELLVARAVAAALAVAAVDQLITLGLEVYRARADGERERAIYEGRLLHLATHPRSLLDNVAATLDYQFGWQVSRTALYRTLQGAVLPLLAFQLLTLWLLSSFVCLEPYEEGLRERFGRAVDGPVLEAGPHLIWPWPIERVLRYPARRVGTLLIGLAREEPQDAPGLNRGASGVVAWASEHDREEPFLSASAGDGADGAASLATAAVVVHYQVSDLRRFVYGFADGEKLLADLAWREATRLFAGADVLAIMSSFGGEAATQLRTRLQRRCDDLGLGVEVVLIGLPDVHPPPPVMAAYEDVSGAAEDATASLLAARGEAAAKVPTARGKADRIVADAKARSYRREMTSEAEAKRFDGQQKALESAPSVFRLRAVLKVLEKELAGRRKTIVASQAAREVTTVDLTEKLRPDLFDIPLEAPAGEGKSDE